MDISFEEAKLRFKPGDHFRINDQIPEDSIFKKDDIVSLTSFYEFMERWGINCEWVKRMPGLRRNDRQSDLAIHCSFIEPVEQTIVCTCDIMVLMRAGCTCGAFVRDELEKTASKILDGYSLLYHQKNP